MTLAPVAPSRYYGAMPIELRGDTPFSRYDWRGQFISVDGTPTDDFGPDDLDEVICCYSDSEKGWSGSCAGMARLKDGRIVGWSSSWDPTGSGFCHDAYGGDAPIFVGRDARTVYTLGLDDEARHWLQWEGA